MRIQNRNMAGAALALRFTRDRKDPALPATVVGDDEGVFDVPERDADFLVQTKGWKRAPKKKPEPEPMPELPPEDPNEPGPDIDGLAKKADAIELRTEWVAKGYAIPEFDENMKLADMKRALNKAIYDEEG